MGIGNSLTMKKIVLLIALLYGYLLNAQTVQKHKIAIFSPLYLDSAYDASLNYKPDKIFPRLFTRGLDFYLGAQMAIDSLQKRSAPIVVFVYVTKSKEPLFQPLNKDEFKDMEMIIAESNAPESRVIAEIARQKKIPFISATLPNDANISGNPYFVLLNATLQTHIEGIYRFLQKYYSLDEIVLFRKAGPQEDQIKNYFTDYAKTTASVPVNIKYIDLPDNFTSNYIARNLDSTKRTICICGTLDELFALHLANELAAINKIYPVTIIGMPTWENMNFSKGELNNLNVIYTSSFYYNHTSLENQLTSQYVSKINSRPSDIFLKGFETTLRFCLLLLDTKRYIAANLSRKGNTIFTQLDIQPVFKNKKTMAVDYFENKHLYFIKVLGGIKNILY